MFVLLLFFNGTLLSYFFYDDVVEGGEMGMKGGEKLLSSHVMGGAGFPNY